MKEFKDVNWDEFTFRCSSLGHIMQDPTGDSNLVKYKKVCEQLEKKLAIFDNIEDSDSPIYQKTYDDIEKINKKKRSLFKVKDLPHLSQSCRNHLADVYTSNVFGYNQDIQNKYVEKGLLLEEDAITQYSLLTGKMYRKNKIRRKNEFIEGELDFEDDEYVFDTKVNWDAQTFNRTAANPIKPLYSWQGKGYMWLFGKKKFKLVYCLLNTPEHLVNQEIKKFQYSFYGSASDLELAIQEIKDNHNYDHIPLVNKVRVYEEYQEFDDIDRISSRVIQCREYLKNFDKNSIQYEIED